VVTERNLALARARLDEATFAIAWAQGQTMTLDQAIEWALAFPPDEIPADPAAKADPARAAPDMPTEPHPDDLTARELDVLRLVAAGLSNAQVAERLVVSPRTVHSHLYSIYSKLGVNSRTAATRYALDHRLV
jgi:DNA-binding NarL/FixJ family response regulator